MDEIGDYKSPITSTPIIKRKSKTVYQTHLNDYQLSFDRNSENSIVNKSKLRSYGEGNIENWTSRKIDLTSRFSGTPSTPNCAEIEKLRRQTISDIDYSAILADRSNYVNKSLSKLRIDESDQSRSVRDFIDYKELYDCATSGGGLTQSMRCDNLIEISNNDDSVSDLESLINIEDKENLNRILSRDESKSLNYNSQVIHDRYRNASGSINRSDWNKYRHRSVSNSSSSREVLSPLSSVKSADLISNNAHNKFIDNFALSRDGDNGCQANHSKHSIVSRYFYNRSDEDGCVDQETHGIYRHKTSRKTETDKYYSKTCVDRISSHNTSSDYVTSKSHKSHTKTIDEVDSIQDCVANMDCSNAILLSKSNKQKILDDYYGRKQRITRDHSGIDQSELSRRTDRSEVISILNLTSDKSEKDDSSDCQKVRQLLRENSELRKIVNCWMNTNVNTADRLAEVNERVTASNSQVESLFETMNQIILNYEVDKKIKERYINVILSQCEIINDQLYPLVNKILSKLNKNDL